MDDTKDAVQAIADELVSRQGSVRNGDRVLEQRSEPVNVTDGLYAIAKAIDRLAQAVEKIAEQQKSPGKPPSYSYRPASGPPLGSRIPSGGRQWVGPGIPHGGQRLG